MGRRSRSSRNAHRLRQVAVLAILLLPGLTRADTDSTLRDISRLLDSCRLLEAPVFAPGTWEEAHKNYQRARTLNDQGGRQAELDPKLKAAKTGALDAIRISGVVRESLSAYLGTRQKARDARAQFIVPREYGRAEDALIAASRKVESGNVEGGQAEARKCEPLFDAAELAAIHRTVLGRADSLLASAELEKAGRFAPVTLGRATSHRDKARTILATDRHNATDAQAEARKAELEYLHAMALGRALGELETRRVTREEQLLEFESELSRLAESAGLPAPPFHVGPAGAVDSLVAGLSGVTSDLNISGSELEQVSSILSKGLAETGEASPSAHPVELATQAAERLMRLTEEKADWARMAQARQAQLAEVSQMADETAYELSRRQEREAKFKAAASLLSVSEGSVLYNDHDDIVLRLTGLSFDPGESQLSNRHEKILAKVDTILKSFAGQNVVVEGHTDARGNKAGNLTLSEKRADAVRSWLLKNSKRDPATLEAKGYGDERPVASNSTSDGRAKNRRIDVVILN